jgi:hypothetical protein
MTERNETVTRWLPWLGLAAVFAFAFALFVLGRRTEYQDAPAPYPPSPYRPSPSSSLPEFPWPPPAASASYVLPDNLFQPRHTMGEEVAFILYALERNGYVERSFFRSGAGGVALVTRLERIDEDGTSFPEQQRWSSGAPRFRSTADLFMILRGLFFVDPGHYRIIVFILQDAPFSQSSEAVSAAEAAGWLRSGTDVLPPEVAARPFAGNHCTVLIYEFASDGTTVRSVESRLTGKRHLEKAGVLSLLGKVK